MNAHANFDISEDEIAAELAKLKRENPEAELERLAKAHRGMVAKCSQRISDTRKGLKATLASLEADRRALKAAYDHDTQFIMERIADAKATAERDIEADRRLVAMSKAALEAAE